MQNSNDTAKVIGALLLGAITGAALGVLFAPNRGSETRSKLVDGAKDLAGDLKRKIKDEVNSLRNKAEELEGLAEDRLDDITRNVKQKVDGLELHH